MGKVEQRLETLERDFQSSRRLNRILVLVILALVGVAAAGDKTPPQSAEVSQASDGKASKADQSLPTPKEGLKTVEMQQLVLSDQHGRARLRMLATDDGTEIRMLDEQGRPQLLLCGSSSGSEIQLLDPEQSSALSLQFARDRKAARVEIRNSQGRTLLRADGMSIHDSADQKRLGLALINGNFPMLGISRSGQTGPPSIELTASDAAKIKLHDTQGLPTFSVSTTEQGATVLGMRHPDHQRSVQISTGARDRDGPKMMFFAPANDDGSGGRLPYLQFGLRKDHQPYLRFDNSEGRPVFSAP